MSIELPHCIKVMKNTNFCLGMHTKELDIYMTHSWAWAEEESRADGLKSRLRPPPPGKTEQQHRAPPPGKTRMNYYRKMTKQGVKVNNLKIFFTILFSTMV